MSSNLLPGGGQSHRAAPPRTNPPTGGNHQRWDIVVSLNKVFAVWTSSVCTCTHKCLILIVICGLLFLKQTSVVIIFTPPIVPYLLWFDNTKTVKYGNKMILVHVYVAVFLPGSVLMIILPAWGTDQEDAGGGWWELCHGGHGHQRKDCQHPSWDTRPQRTHQDQGWVRIWVEFNSPTALAPNNYNYCNSTMYNYVCNCICTCKWYTLTYTLYVLSGTVFSVMSMYILFTNTHTHTHIPTHSPPTTDKATLEELAEKVEEASKVLQEYITRLDAELQERNDIQELLDAFIWQQKSLLKTAKKNLKDHQSKLESISNVREELKSHLANLPDLSKLPMGKMKSLEPLPSVGDLFN